MSTDSIFAQLSAKWDDDVSYLRRPVQWCADKPKHYLHDMQRRVAESVRDNRYTAVPSAHELGKSLVAADLVAWWIDSHPVGQAMVISTAPSFHQVAAILWREIGRTHKAADLTGKINRSPTPQWIIGGEAVGFGRKPADHEESAFQGMHNRYVLVVIDEACGVDKRLYDAIRSIVANEHSRVLAIGNPDDPGSHFKEICEPGSIWNVIRLDALRSPNFSKAQIVGEDETQPRYPLTKALMEAEQIPYSTEKVSLELSENLCGPLYCEESLVDWCGVPKDAADTMDTDELKRLLLNRTADSPLFTSKVRGQFPSATATGAIPLGWVERAMERWQDWMDAGGDRSKVPNPTRRVVGVDVAYGGLDETVVAVRFGSCITELHRYRNADTIETAKEAAVHLHETGAVAVVDVIGIGAGVFDTLRDWRRKNLHIADVIPFNAAASSSRKDAIGQFKFRNDRAAAWWNLRQLLDPSRGSTLMLPNDARLKQELVAVKYKHLAGGIIQIESKDDIKKRLGRSTDSADACLVPETLVWTETGQRRLDEIEVGERVWTRRDGLRRVLRSGCTQRDALLVTVELSDGRSITGTPSHPVWDGARFRPLGEFQAGSTMLVCQYAENPSLSTTSSSLATPIARTDTFASTSAPTANTARTASSRFTARSTRPTTGRFRKAGTYITSTTIRSTTTRAISWPRVNSITSAITASKSRATSASATDAGSTSTIQAATRSACGALATAMRSGTARIAPTRRQRLARSAERSSTSIDPSFGSALVVVVRSTASGTSDVYNLAVEGTPEFYANGILVHNCIQAFWVDGLVYTEAPKAKGKSGYEYSQDKDYEYAYAGTDGGFTPDDVVASRPGARNSPVRRALRPSNPYRGDDDAPGW